MEHTEQNEVVNTASNPCYIMVQVNFKNMEDSMQRYGQFAMPIIANHGGKMIAGTMTPTSLEGDWQGNWAAILEFPTKEAALNFHKAADYQPYLDLRLNELQSDSRVLVVEGM
ncbi:MAG: DUF1330 domain-containing protein [Chitinophagia bacterium]|nr:DUF1330 domain-containing protein [Chitinophagia bacterium]